MELETTPTRLEPMKLHEHNQKQKRAQESSLPGVLFTTFVVYDQVVVFAGIPIFRYAKSIVSMGNDDDQR